MDLEEKLAKASVSFEEVKEVFLREEERYNSLSEDEQIKEDLLEISKSTTAPEYRATVLDMPECVDKIIQRAIDRIKLLAQNNHNLTVLLSAVTGTVKDLQEENSQLNRDKEELDQQLHVVCKEGRRLLDKNKKLKEQLGMIAIKRPNGHNLHSQ